MRSNRLRTKSSNEQGHQRKNTEFNKGRQTNGQAQFKIMSNGRWLGPRPLSKDPSHRYMGKLYDTADG